jgi:hypothetical protein
MSWFKVDNKSEPMVVQGRDVGAFSDALTSAQPYDMSSNNAPDGAQPGIPEKTERGFRDVFFGILFYAHLGAIVYTSAVYAPQAALAAADNVQGGGGRRSLLGRWLEEDGGGDEQEIEIDPGALLSVLVVAGILSFIFSSLALGFMMRFAETLIKIALWFNIILFLVMALLSLAAGVIPSALMFLFFSGLSAYYAYRVWSRIPFAASNLVTAVSAVQDNMGLSVYAYWSGVLLFVWSILWVVSASSTIYVLGNCNEEGECESVNGGIVFLFVLSYYWTAQGKRRRRSES